MSWSESKRHDGKGCPLPKGTRVRCILEGDPGDFSAEMEGTVGSGDGVSWDWSNWRKPDENGAPIARITKYRVWTPDQPTRNERGDLEEA